MATRHSKLITLFALSGVCLALSAFAPEGVEGLCDSPVVGGHTGAPNETSCAGCHSGTVNSGSAQITISLGDNGTYVPGTQYTGTVTMARPGREKFGFCCLALQDAGNVNLGGFGLLETLRTRTYMDGARSYVSHTPCGADAQDSTGWSFTWQAPATDVGSITIYMGNLVANHSHTTSGDESYKQSITLTPSTVGIDDVNAGAAAFQIYPNPAKNNVSVVVPEGQNIERLRLLDVRGVLIMEKGTKGQRTIDLALDGLSAGTYTIELISGAGKLRQRFVREP